jgi:hypothetical protein
VDDPEVGAAAIETIEALAGVPAGTAVANLVVALPEVSAGTLAHFEGDAGRRLVVRGLVALDYEIGLPTALLAFNHSSQLYASILSHMEAATPEEVTSILREALRGRRPTGAAVAQESALAAAPNVSGTEAELDAADYYAPTVIEVLQPVMHDTTPEATEMLQSQAPAMGRHTRFWLAGGIGIGFAMLCCAVGRVCAAQTERLVPPRCDVGVDRVQGPTLTKIAAISEELAAMDCRPTAALEPPCWVEDSMQRSMCQVPEVNTAAEKWHPVTVVHAPPPSPRRGQRSRSQVNASELTVALTQLAENHSPSPSPSQRLQALDNWTAADDRGGTSSGASAKAEKDRPVGRIHIGNKAAAVAPAGEFEERIEEMVMRLATRSVTQNTDVVRRGGDKEQTTDQTRSKDTRNTLFDELQQAFGSPKALALGSPRSPPYSRPVIGHGCYDEDIPTGLPRKSHSSSVALAQHYSESRSGSPMNPTIGWPCCCSADRAAVAKDPELRRVPCDSRMTSPKCDRIMPHTSFFI